MRCPGLSCPPLSAAIVTMVEAEAQSRARELLTAADGRVTPARLAVLEILLDSAAALSHHELEDAVEKHGVDVDRVTLYRVLDWLVERGLAHRIAADDRVWRFNAAERLQAANTRIFTAPDAGRSSAWMARIRRPLLRFRRGISRSARRSPSTAAAPAAPVESARPFSRQAINATRLQIHARRW